MAKKTPQQVAPKTFEEALRELEDILQEIEAGSLGLEESLTKYERGNFLITHCRGVLNAAERQIEQVSGSADGGVTTAPLKLRADEAVVIAAAVEAAADDGDDEDDAGDRGSRD
jgi:exodeoxyribonuclease VII small subunit